MRWLMLMSSHTLWTRLSVQNNAVLYLYYVYLYVYVELTDNFGLVVFVFLECLLQSRDLSLMSSMIPCQWGLNWMLNSFIYTKQVRNQYHRELTEVMELSPSQKICASYTARDNCSLRRAERTKKNRDLFYRRGSKILPDYFPPDTYSRNLGFHQTTVPHQRRFLVKEYSFEAQEIAESWMMYFGIDVTH